MADIHITKWFRVPKPSDSIRSFQRDLVAIPCPKNHHVTPSRYDRKPSVETEEKGTHKRKSQQVAL